MICILVLYTEGWSNIAGIVLPNIKAYAKKYGYTLRHECFPEPYPSDFGYKKLEKTQALLDEGFEAVWNLDLDTLITDMNFKVDDWLNVQDSLFITESVNGINAGSFILMNTQWSRWFINECLKRRGDEGVYCEQDAMNDFIKEYGWNNICIMPHPSINSFRYDLYPEHPEIREVKDGHWVEGSSFVLHLPGISMSDRYRILSTTKITL
jgi:hypothetical protein